MNRSTDPDQDSIGEETGGEEIRLAFQSALEALLDQGVDLCVGHIAAEQVVFCIQQDAHQIAVEPFLNEGIHGLAQFVHGEP